MAISRSERLLERQEITADVVGVMLGLLWKMMKFEDDVQHWVSIAGDDDAEMRRMVGLFAVDKSKSIEHKMESCKKNILQCLVFEQSAILIEESDYWNEKTAVHGQRIDKLVIEQRAVKRVLVMEIPWPDIIRQGLGVQNRSGNTQVMDSATMRALEEATQGLLPPPGTGDTESEETPPETLPTPEPTTDTSTTVPPTTETTTDGESSTTESSD